MPDETATPCETPPMDQREYGELIATVKHLAEELGGMRSMFERETAKLHARIDEFPKYMTPREMHERLRHDVDEIAEDGRETRRIVDALRNEQARSGEGQRWQRDLLWLVLAVVVGAGGYLTGGG
ncbi:hypothetical protein [Algiphilus sp.]|uniref:hypothetical protein n=1 Tax=Algiphilus sp. TaxID=1872431 RepID=UPI0025B9771F|nr:hypothetical protein [Algiphilus sp.]MCK5769483.1 hypothetical protein [Algiphilus sp.]